MRDVSPCHKHADSKLPIRGCKPLNMCSIKVQMLECIKKQNNKVSSVHRKEVQNRCLSYLCLISKCRFVSEDDLCVLCSVTSVQCSFSLSPGWSAPILASRDISE